MKALIDVFTWGMIAYGLYGLITTMWSIISKKGGRIIYEDIQGV